MKRAWTITFLSFSLAASLSASISAAAQAETPTNREVAARLLESPDSVEILSVDAGRWSDFGYGREKAPFDAAENSSIEGDGVFGRVVLTDPKLIAEIAAAFEAGYQKEGPQAHCYIPHHVLVVRSGEESVHLHLCFSCHYAVVIHKGTETAHYESFQDDAGLARLLNDHLTKAGIPIMEDRAPPLPTLDEATLAKTLTAEQRAIIETPDSLTVFSIDPTERWRNFAKDAERPIEAIEKALRDSKKTLGHTAIQSAGARMELAMKTLGLIQADAMQARCFDPRHALLFEKGDQKLCLIACFQCSNMALVDAGGMRKYLIAIDDVSGLKGRLNGILTRRGISIAP